MVNRAWPFAVIDSWRHLVIFLRNIIVYEMLTSLILILYIFDTSICSDQMRKQFGKLLLKWVLENCQIKARICQNITY